MKRLACAAALMMLGLAATPVVAQDQTAQATPQQTARREQRRQARERRFERRFQRLDANRDGVIARDEWKRRPQAFDRLDRNHDGVLSRDELRPAVRRAIARRRRR